jgi:hypothetical protein
MQVLPVEVSDSTYRLWEQLSVDDKRNLKEFETCQLVSPKISARSVGIV